MHAELQKFGRAPAELSRLVAAGHDFTSAHAEETVGLDLSVAEDKALSAIQILLDRRHYRGNAPDAGEEESESFRWRGTRPRLVVTWAEFFEALRSQAGPPWTVPGKGRPGSKEGPHEPDQAPADRLLATAL